MTAAPPTRAPLLPPAVTVLWFLALLSWASGRVGGIVGVPLGSAPTSLAVVLGAVGLGMLYNRRGFDRLTRVPAVSAVVMAIASALAAVGVMALVVAGPDRPIGLIDLEVGATVSIATAAASASTVVLIRPYVDPMVAHVWAGIAGAGLALPFMIAGISPAFIMAGAIGLGVVDRVRGARTERELAFRKQLEAERAAEAGDGGRGIGVSGLPGLPPVPRAPRPRLPWSAAERRASLVLGLGALLLVVAAWMAGVASAEFPGPAALGAGQGFALASLGAIPLLVQTALLLRLARPLREALAVAGGMLVLASAAILTAPIDAVHLGAIGLQSLAVAGIAALLVRGVRGARLGTMLMAGTAAAISWWLIVVPTGAAVLAFAAVLTTLLALRRKVTS